MDERKRLYLKLRQQIHSIIPLLKRVERTKSEVIIGKIHISSEEYSEMEKNFKKVHNTCYSKDVVEKLQNNFIPLALASQNMFFRDIQVTLNKIHKENLERIFKDDKNER